MLGFQSCLLTNKPHLIHQDNQLKYN